jgi:hypothetical protein
MDKNFLPQAYVEKFFIVAILSPTTLSAPLVLKTFKNNLENTL